MSTLVEGRNAVLEALRAGVPVAAVLLASGSEGGPIDEIRRLATARGIGVRTVSRRVLDERSVRGAHQGAMAEMAPFSYTPLAEVLERVGEREASLVVVLDHITDEGNLGAVARSAEVAGADALVIPKARSAGVGPAAYRTSAGALAHLPVIREPNLVRALERLKKAGYWVAGATQSATTVAWDAPLEGRLALVMGSEGEGLSRLVEKACDFTVRLPVAGRVGSLNVAQAATVLAFEWVRRRNDIR
ncbi:MAG: 23S rRNA (guanosine(2251)-2'-O)-methyltransferase RlmB [Coriobacteriia bacterium]|nr:23S rRNA (guanosine(2251)-2'-O)-methyltransferase RlmB [Coriobacteriia bacterium]